MEVMINTYKNEFASACLFFKPMTFYEFENKILRIEHIDRSTENMNIYVQPKASENICFGKYWFINIIK